MPIFVILGKWTQKGLATLKNFSENLKAGTNVFESHGVKIKEFVGTMGRYDFVAICEAPNAEAISKALLSRVSEGRFKTETLRGFTAEKMSELVQGI
ncbi:MAG: GYD domain-containing protein [Candidatus Bathyarchaeota archaeon]|nr:MAG: GYD domain-containing protein [Candidatus Bathyarchaeota archaeon]